jgi:hypothetical protein
MSPRSTRPARNPVTVALCLMALTFVVGMLAAASAHAAYYKTLYCGAADGSGNPTLGARPGFFDFTDDCGTAYGDPAGTGGFLRLEENTTGTAGNTDEASYSWWAPPGTSIAALSAYTRVPGYFNLGWRSRFWAEGFDGSENNILMQGSGVANEGIYAPATSNFVFHAWPFGGFGDYKRLVFAMTCYRPAGCSREGWNAADANSIAITLNDKEVPHVNWEGDSHVLAGDWVRGYNPIAWRESDVGSGLRFSRLGVDGALLGDGTIDYQANGGCRTGRSDANGEFARDFQPCTPGPYLRYYGLETKSFSDGQHQIAICVQDYSQYQHINGSASESCDARTIHTDNTAPGKPAGLEVTSANPQRYLDHFSAKWTLPPNSGSPIAKVHFDVLDALGKVVVPEKVVSGTDLTALAEIRGPPTPGAYTLRVWLEDSVGLVGAPATAPIPHDTTPPAAPQGLSVAAPRSARQAGDFDARWHDLTDSGSPIAAARYEVTDSHGAVVVAPQTLSGQNVEGAQKIETPEGASRYDLHVWLVDEEGNVGAPASVPLSYECVRSKAAGGTALGTGFGLNGGEGETIVSQGTGATLNGTLKGADGGVSNASICVFARVVTGPGREFLGIATTGEGGRFQFSAQPGPSREFEALYRPGQSQLSATATLYTRVIPTFRVAKGTVHNGQFARFSGEIPGPNNDHVVIVLQVRQGKGWRVFRRYRTRDDGHYTLNYRFRRITDPARFKMRAQVRETVGYAYLQGNSRELTLKVLP